MGWGRNFWEVLIWNGLDCKLNVQLMHAYLYITYQLRPHLQEMIPNWPRCMQQILIYIKANISLFRDHNFLRCDCITGCSRQQGLHPVPVPHLRSGRHPVDRSERRCIQRQHPRPIVVRRQSRWWAARAVQDWIASDDRTASILEANAYHELYSLISAWLTVDSMVLRLNLWLNLFSVQTFATSASAKRTFSLLIYLHAGFVRLNVK